MELGELMLQETVSVSTNFTLELSSILRKSQFHKLPLSLLTHWLSSFLISCAIKNHDSVGFKIKNRFLNVQTSYITLILLFEKNQYSYLNSYTFHLKGGNPSQTQLASATAMEAIKNITCHARILHGLQMFDYVLFKDSSEYYALVRRYKKLAMLCVHTALNRLKEIERHQSGLEYFYDPNKVRSFMDSKHILEFAQYFVNYYFSIHIDHFKMSVETLYISMHAILIGNYRVSHGIHASTYFSDKDTLSHLAFRIESDTSVSNNDQLVVLHLQFSERRKNSMLYQMQLPDSTNFIHSSLSFVSVSCKDNDCFSYQESYKKRTRWESLNRCQALLKPFEKTSFVGILRNQLSNIAMTDKLSSTLIGYFRTHTCATDMFDWIGVLIPDTFVNYTTFLHNFDGFVYIISVFGSSTTENDVIHRDTTMTPYYPDSFYAGLDISFVYETASNVFKKISRSNVSGSSLTMPKDYFNRYRVIINERNSTKAIAKKTDNRKFYYLRYGSSVENIDLIDSLSVTCRNCLIDIISRHNIMYKNVEELKAFLNGVAKQYSNVYRVVHSDILIFNDDPISSLYFTVILHPRQFNNANKFSIDLADVKNRIRTNNFQRFKINLISLYVENLNNLSTCTICYPLTDVKTKCLQYTPNNMEFEYRPIEYRLSSVIPSEIEEDFNVMSETTRNLYYRNIDVNRMETPPIIRSTHKLLLYTYLGFNILSYVSFKLRNVANMKQLTEVLYEEDTTHCNKVSNQLDQMIWNDENLRSLKVQYSSLFQPIMWNNTSIIKVYDGLSIGLIEISPSKQFQATLMTRGIHLLEGKLSKDHIAIIQSGMISMQTGDGNDLIILKSPVGLSGFINAKGGVNTIMILQKENDKQDIIGLTVEKDGILKIYMETGENLIVSNVHNLIGSQYTADLLSLKCGVKLINMKGGTSETPDIIIVDLCNCPEADTNVIINSFTYVEQKCGNHNLTYTINGDRDIKLVFNRNDKERIGIIDKVYILKRFTYVEDKNVLIEKNNANVIIILGNPVHGIILENVDENVGILFLDGYLMKVKNGRVWAEKSYDIQRSSAIPQQKRTIAHVFNGEVIKQTLDYVLPETFKLFENHPEASLTYFSKQPIDNIPQVYLIKAYCNNNENLRQVQSIVVFPRSNKHLQYIDLREIIRPYENQGYTTEFGSQNKRSQNWMNLLVYVRLFNKKVEIANINFDIKTKYNFEKVRLLTSRYVYKIKEVKYNRRPPILKTEKIKNKLIFVDHIERCDLYAEITQGASQVTTHGDMELFGSTSSPGAIFMKRRL